MILDGHMKRRWKRSGLQHDLPEPARAVLCCGLAWPVLCHRPLLISLDKAMPLVKILRYPTSYL